MLIRIFNHFLRLKNRLDLCYLCVFYLIGLFVGSVVSALLASTVSPDFTAELLIRPPVLNLLFINLVPVIFISLLLYFSLRILAYPVMLFQAIILGFTGTFISLLAGDGGWLIRLLLMFSCNAISVLVWYLLLFVPKGMPRGCFVGSVAVSLGITLIDYFAVSQFLQHLIVYF